MCGVAEADLQYAPRDEIDVCRNWSLRNQVFRVAASDDDLLLAVGHVDAHS